LRAAYLVYCCINITDSVLGVALVSVIAGDPVSTIEWIVIVAISAGVAIGARMSDGTSIRGLLPQRALRPG
jgi:hypothetical protein